jgi:hypothetical protein
MFTALQSKRYTDILPGTQNGISSGVKEQNCPEAQNTPAGIQGISSEGGW